MIRKAEFKDIEEIVNCYEEFMLYEKEHVVYTVWQSGVYPTRETAEAGFKAGALYVLEQSGEICASIIIDQIQPEEYGRINWKCDAEQDEVVVVHLLCVRPSKSGHGYGSELIRFAIQEGKRLNCRAVRLDTGKQNIPAVSLYQKLGFEIAGSSARVIGGAIAHKNHLFLERQIAD